MHTVHTMRYTFIPERKETIHTIKTWFTISWITYYYLGFSGLHYMFVFWFAEGNFTVAECICQRRLVRDDFHCTNCRYNSTLWKVNNKQMYKYLHEHDYTVHGCVDDEWKTRQKQMRTPNWISRIQNGKVFGHGNVRVCVCAIASECRTCGV